MLRCCSAAIRVSAKCRWTPAKPYFDALQSRGVDAHAWDPAERTMAQFANAGFDRAWIALHGTGGEDGALQGCLQWLDVPYTGSGVKGSAIAMDKARSKQLFALAGVPTPEFVVVHGTDVDTGIVDRLGLPLIVKPNAQGSSVGMSKVLDVADLGAAIEYALQFDADVLLETCIDGSELTVGILQGEALPSIRIETPRKFYDYRAKYQSDRTRYVCPGTSADDEERQYAELALRAFDALGCSGWGRVDFMTGTDGRPTVLEVNTVPGMTSHSLVPKAAGVVGIDFPELCWRILETSLRRPLAESGQEAVRHGT